MRKGGSPYPSATLQRRNTQLGNQFTRLGQQVHDFGHRIGKDDPRRPASTGFKIEEVTPIGCIPEPAAIGALDPKAVTIATNTGRTETWMLKALLFLQVAARY
jgi:hypothetical protein